MSGDQTTWKATAHDGDLLLVECRRTAEGSWIVIGSDMVWCAADGEEFVSPEAALAHLRAAWDEQAASA